MKRVVVYGGTENLYDAIYVSLNSLLTNTKIDRVYLLIEHDVFPYTLPNFVKTINVSGQTYFPEDSPNVKTRWRYMTLMRLVLPKLLPRFKKALWLDCDTIIDADISELFDIDLTGYYVAGVKEPQKSENRIYLNAGVLLFNLEEIRKDRFHERLMEYANSVKLHYPDQDAINDLAQGKIKVISGAYNYTPFTEQANARKIYHFAANMYFRNQSMFIKYKNWGVLIGKDADSRTLF